MLRSKGDYIIIKSLQEYKNVQKAIQIYLIHHLSVLAKEVPLEVKTLSDMKLNLHCERLSSMIGISGDYIDFHCVESSSQQMH